MNSKIRHTHKTPTIPKLENSEVLQVIESVVGPEGIEPPTLGLEIRCSIRLSYGPLFTQGQQKQ